MNKIELVMQVGTLWLRFLNKQIDDDTLMDSLDKVVKEYKAL
ncbi:hypothetical protein UFOVP1196_11 [uncultured Caudovirales phage]|uniref:Uncharacterized protein n=1 Tax=uncultured Caudovirales phage TaxID=2100421 RepID=A0A6J5R502_9CAUD|nr:hypothetical protein UFOVP1196_11 [uncultured Caudovirales phage]